MKLRDKKFSIAIIIIILLAIALIYVLYLGPTIQGYFIKKETKAQEQVINTIVDVVNQQGYVVLNTEKEQIILVKYQQPSEQPTQPPAEQPANVPTNQPIEPVQ